MTNETQVSFGVRGLVAVKWVGAYNLREPLNAALLGRQVSQARKAATGRRTP